MNMANAKPRLCHAVAVIPVLPLSSIVTFSFRKFYLWPMILQLSPFLKALFKFFNKFFFTNVSYSQSIKSQIKAFRKPNMIYDCFLVNQEISSNVFLTIKSFTILDKTV